MVGHALAFLNILQDRIARGERPLVEQEFIELKHKASSKRVKASDVEFEHDPLAINEMLDIYATALGYPPISGMVQIR